MGTSDRSKDLIGLIWLVRMIEKREERGDKRRDEEQRGVGHQD
jgi:hypothetical protein